MFMHALCLFAVIYFQLLASYIIIYLYHNFILFTIMSSLLSPVSCMYIGSLIMVINNNIIIIMTYYIYLLFIVKKSRGVM